MKHFVLLKLAVLVAGIGTAMLLTPACRAQSEVNPDHFDGTDSWSRAGQMTHLPVLKQQVAKASLQEKRQKTNQGSGIQLAAVREASKPVNPEAIAADRKRKAAAGTPEKQ